MHFLKSLIGTHPAPRRAPDIPEGKLRIHLFSGIFENKGLADDYCFKAPDPNTPEPLTCDLPGAFIDTQQVEVTFGNITERLSAFLDDATMQTLLGQIRSDNTLIIITDLAFGGFPYALNNTPKLTYHGAQIVDI